jgi:hypothetical protein
VKTSLRSCLTTGVAIITATAVAFGPSVRAPAPAAPHVVHVAAPTMVLTAGVQPLAGAPITDILSFIVVPPSAGKPFPTPHFPPVVAPTSIGNSIIGIYNAVEPWARWVADVAAYAVGWVPYVGWLSGQIPIFYNFGERIARSITYNIAYWLDGKISFGQGLINVGYDTVNAFIQLGIDQWNFWLWPLPPLPPIFPGALAATTAEVTTAAVTDQRTTADATADTPKLKKKEREAAGEAAGSEAPAASDATEPEQGPRTDTVKKPKEPKVTKVTTDVAAQDDVSTAPNDAPKKGPDAGKKKADKDAANAGTESSTSSKDNDNKKDAKKDATQ